MPNRRAVIYLIIMSFVVMGLVVGQSFFFNLALLLTFLVIISYLWVVISLYGLQLKRFTSTLQCQVGQEIAEVMQLHNTTWLPKIWLEVEDQSNLSNHQASVIIPFLAPYSTFTWQLKTRCDQRGEYLLGPINITTIDPFGIFMISKKIKQTAKLIVFPSSFQIDNLYLPRPTLTGGARRNEPSRSITTNAVSVREYRQGDSFRSIHWSSSAKKDVLMVKEFEVDLITDIWLIADFAVDFSQQDQAINQHTLSQQLINNQLEVRSMAEYMVVIVASLAKYFTRKQYSMGYVAYSEKRIVYQPERQIQLHRKIQRHLTTIQHKSGLDLWKVLEIENHHIKHGTSVVIVTSNTDNDWVKKILSLKKRGIMPLCVLLEPQSFGIPQSMVANQYLLHTAQIPTLLVRYGDNLKQALSQNMRTR